MEEERGTEGQQGEGQSPSQPRPASPVSQHGDHGHHQRHQPQVGRVGELRLSAREEDRKPRIEQIRAMLQPSPKGLGGLEGWGKRPSPDAPGKARLTHPEHGPGQGLAEQQRAPTNERRADQGWMTAAGRGGLRGPASGEDPEGDDRVHPGGPVAVVGPAVPSHGQRQGGQHAIAGTARVEEAQQQGQLQQDPAHPEVLGGPLGAGREQPLGCAGARGAPPGRPPHTAGQQRAGQPRHQQPAPEHGVVARGGTSPGSQGEEGEVSRVDQDEREAVGVAQQFGVTEEGGALPKRSPQAPDVARRVAPSCGQRRARPDPRKGPGHQQRGEEQGQQQRQVTSHEADSTPMGPGQVEARPGRRRRTGPGLGREGSTG